MYVTAEIVSDGAKGVAVSAKAMFLKNNQYYCFVESAPGRFERRAITLGIQNGSRITIITGVDAGQQVVTEGCLLLQNILENGANS
jgi:cobalt-zinc-cadmium efflux system membrane fusion protein